MFIDQCVGTDVIALLLWKCWTGGVLLSPGVALSGNIPPGEAASGLYAKMPFESVIHRRQGKDTMWFIGLLIGMLLGSTFRLGEGTIWGGMLGALVGAMISFLSKQSRASAIEPRVAALEFAVSELRRNLAQATPMQASAAATSPEPSNAKEGLEPLPEIALTARGEPSWIPQGPVEAQTPIESPVPAPTYVEPAFSQAAEPSAFDRAWAWLTGGNALVRVGVVVLFFGVAFLFKYAYEHTHVPIEVRLIGVALGAAAMLVIGWRLRQAKPVYALAMQGGGVGLLFLTVFGAFRLFNLIPGEAAFFLLVAIAVFSAVLAVLQNAMSLAVLGVSGGFLAPVLASTGGGSHVMLFSYYAVLNAAVLAIALYKAWRALNVVGFVFTFGIGAVWGARYYRPELFDTTEPFLVLFFIQSLVIAVLFTILYNGIGLLVSEIRKAPQPFKINFIDLYFGDACRINTYSDFYLIVLCSINTIN
ncbi:MAG: DUF2339 domain-containing protein, partial [Betaproteobacteria bacterium]